MNNTEIRSFLAWAKDHGVTFRDYYAYLVNTHQISDFGYKGRGQRLMVCPLHNDDQPSLGTIIDKDGVEIFHCFGCGQAGTVVDFAAKLNETTSSREQSLRQVLQALGKDPSELLVEWQSEARQPRATIKPQVDPERVPYSKVLEVMVRPGATMNQITNILERAIITNVYKVKE